MMGLIESFQYIGSVFILSSQYVRSQPKLIYNSFILSLVGSIILLIYSVATSQYGYVSLNVFSIIMAIVGIKNWGDKLKKSSQELRTKAKRPEYIEYVD